MEVERFGVDHQSYPPDLQTLLRERNIQMGSNPFGPGELKILEPADPWEPGGVIYMAWGPTVLEGNSGHGSTSATASVLESYILLGYSPKNQPSKEAVLERTKRDLERIFATPQKGFQDFVNQLPAEAEQIDWNHVEILRISAVEYESKR